jgi:SAM-dependent methyltransferase
MEKSTTITSPITLQANVVLRDILAAQDIVSEYKRALDIDVSGYFEGHPEIAIYECATTGFRFFYPAAIFADAKFYALLQSKAALCYYREWQWEHEMALRALTPQSTVLEVGCGTGSFLRTLTTKGFDVAGLELNDAAVDVCRQQGLTVYNELLESHRSQHSGQYDAVCAFQVLEHVYDVRSFINECLTCLKRGGKLIVAVPNNNPYLFKYDKYHALNLPPHHAGLWNSAAFQKLPDFFPLEVDEITVEPLYERRYFLDVFIKHFDLWRTRALLAKLPPELVTAMLWPLPLFVQGRNILAIFRKAADVASD